MRFTPFASDIYEMNYRVVSVIPESIDREQRRGFRTCFSDEPEPKRISFAQLYETLAHGALDHYILAGA